MQANAKNSCSGRFKETVVQLVPGGERSLAHLSDGELGELHLQAMKLLVEKLEKQKFAVTARPRQSGESKAAPAERAKQQGKGRQQEQEQEREPQQGQEPQQRPVPKPGENEVHARDEPLWRRSRHIPAAVKREVFVRDGGRCSYVDERGVRCGETRYLELHHLRPYAQGGRHVAANVTLRCAAHNALAAEEDSGREWVQRKRDSARHESFAASLVRDSLVRDSAASLARGKDLPGLGSDI